MKVVKVVTLSIAKKRARFCIILHTIRTDLATCGMGPLSTVFRSIRKPDRAPDTMGPGQILLIAVMGSGCGRYLWHQEELNAAQPEYFGRLLRSTSFTNSSR